MLFRSRRATHGAMKRTAKEHAALALVGSREVVALRAAPHADTPAAVAVSVGGKKRKATKRKRDQTEINKNSVRKFLIRIKTFSFFSSGPKSVERDQRD